MRHALRRSLGRCKVWERLVRPPDRALQLCDLVLKGRLERRHISAICGAMGFIRRMAATANMTPFRVILALLVLSSLLGLQAWQTIYKRDDWPLSAFPMYSGLQGRYTSRVILVGVTPEGEVPLGKKYTRPLVGARLRWALRKHDKLVTRIVAKKICGEEADAKGLKEFSAIRSYTTTWKIRAGLKGIDRPHKKLRQTYAAFCPERIAELKAEAAGTSPPAAPLEARPDDIVLEAESATFWGSARPVADDYAQGGLALELWGKGQSKRPSKSPEGTAGFEFEAKAGTYYVWLRGKSNEGTRNDSVWFQVNEQIGRHKSVHKSGLGNFRGVFPAQAYAWASKRPLAKPAKIRFRKNGKQRIRISLREGPVIIDQILLTKHWPEHPLHNRPVKP